MPIIKSPKISTDDPFADNPASTSPNGDYDDIPLKNLTIPSKTGRITTFESRYLKHSNSNSSLSRTWLASSEDLQPASPHPLKSVSTPTDSDGNALIAPWGIHWRTPISMVGLFLVGLGTAIAHHYYYNFLHATPAGTAEAQEWVNRIGTGLAFLSRAALSGVIEIARKQWVWVTLREKSMSLMGINAMFGAGTDPMNFFSGEMLARAKFNTFLAMVIWSLPVVAIFTPTTITVFSSGQEKVGECVVPSLSFNFGAEPLDGLKWYNLSNGTTLGDIFEEVYHNPSPRASSIFTTAAFSGQPLVATDTVLEEDCGEMCTYSIQFTGPAVNCTEQAFWEVDDPLSNTTVPRQSKDGLSPVFSGARAEKVWNQLLVGNLRTPGDETEDSDTWEWHGYSCVNSIALYSVTININDGRMRKPTIDAVKLLYPVTEEPSFNTTYSRIHISNWALFDTLVDILAGDVSTGISHFNYSMDGVQYYKSAQEMRITQTKVLSTSLASPKSTTNNMKTVANLAPAIEVMVQNMVVSLLSDRTLIYATNITTTCRSTEFRNIYTYNWEKLVGVYSVGVFMALAICMLGFVALAKNGVVSDDSFSTFLLTTRNPTLDRLAAGACLGGEPLPRELQRLKFRFGVVGEREEGVGHVALGLEEEVVGIKRGGRYS